MSADKPEPTQPGNPHQLTIDQHIHSKFCIKRFANSDGLVGLLKRGTSTPSQPIGPAAKVFCAQRVWNEHLEHGKLLSEIEANFLNEVESVLTTRSVTSHRAVTEYLSMWQIRARLNEDRPSDVVLNGITGSGLSRDQEERLEKRGIGFVREGGVVPGRLNSFLHARRQHDRNMQDLQTLRWGVWRTSGSTRFVCPDRPNSWAYIPITPELALVAGLGDGSADDATVRAWNREAYENSLRFVFGHPDDIQAFALGVMRAALLDLISRRTARQV